MSDRKLVTCVALGPDDDVVPVHEMTLEQARQAVEVLAAEIRFMQETDRRHGALFGDLLRSPRRR